MARTRDSILVAALVLSGAVTLATAAGCSGSDAKDGATSSSDVISSPDLVIRAVYGGGGNTNAPLKADFVELFNRGQEPVSLNGKSLQYAGSTFAFAGGSSIVALPDAVIQPGKSFLVKMKDGANGVDLPVAADFTPATPINFGAADGKIALVPTAAPLNGCGTQEAPCSPDLFIDLVSYGNASQAEGSPVSALSNTKAAFRKMNGCSDIGNNSSDFEVVTVTPEMVRSAAAPAAPCDPDAGGAPADAGPAPDAASDAAPAQDAGPAPEAGPTPTSAVLLNELKINPPGNTDTPWEYAELLCPASSSLKGYYFVALEGDGDSSTGSPGVADIVVDLSDKNCGSNGLVMIKAANGGHTPAQGTTVVGVPLLDTGTGPFENATTSFVLIKSPTNPIVQGNDYDTANDGTLTLPAGASIVDGVSTFDQGEGVTDQTYAPRLTKAGITADAAGRLLGVATAMSADAWFFGDLKGTKGDSLDFDPARSSANLPKGATLTPGAPNVATTSTKPGGGDPDDPGTDPTDDGEEDPGDPPGDPSTGNSSGSSSSPGRLAQPPAQPKNQDSGSCSATTSSTPSGTAFLGIGLALAALIARRKR